ncbi:MAG: enoyl-CoA hydratase/isomerase family protein [Pararhodobacter sp.]|nr:enoyl-CoA hydratase/isomerase family protein [Pararhodobacter sp.]
MHEDHGAGPEQQHNAPETLRGAGAPEDYVQRRTQDGIAILTLAGPGGNRFTHDLVQALERALAAALRDGGVRAVVITARGPDFCAGPHADLPPPGPEPTPEPPILDAVNRLCRHVADSPRPVICALHGRVTSGGLALALAAQMRLADPRAALHFPETRLARMPPGNGAVRLAWQVGARTSLAFLARETPMPANAALAAGLIDAIEPEGLLPAAIARAQALAMAVPSGPSVPGLQDAPGFRAGVAAARAALPHHLPTHRHHQAQIIDVIEAAQLLPPEQALEFDAVLARDCATAPAARALAHLARAARRVLDTPEARTDGPRPPRTGPIAVALSPAEAVLLVPPLLRAGERVALIMWDNDQLTATLEAVAEAQLAAVAAGQLAQSDSDADWARLSGAQTADPGAPAGLALAGAGLAEELEAALPTACPLLIWNAPVPALTRPERAMSLMPAPVRGRTGLPQLVELVVPPGLAPHCAAAATEMVLALHLTPLRAGTAALIPPLLSAARHAAARLATLGVPTKALRDCGLLPPAALMPETPDPVQPPAAATDLPLPVDLPLPAEQLILLALINAGAHLLETAQALRPSDIDIAMVLGAGYPNWRGGPMAEADGMGPLVLRHLLQQAAPLAPDLWHPAPLIDELIRQSWRFEDLNTD